MHPEQQTHAEHISKVYLLLLRVSSGEIDQLVIALAATVSVAEPIVCFALSSRRLPSITVLPEADASGRNELLAFSRSSG